MLIAYLQKSDMFFPPQNVAISEEVQIQKSASLLTLATWQSPKTYCPFWGVRVLCFSTVPIIWGWESRKHHLIIKEGEWLLFWAQTNVTDSYIPIFMLPNSIKDGDWNSPISSQISSKKKKTRTENIFLPLFYTRTLERFLCKHFSTQLLILQDWFTLWQPQISLSHIFQRQKCCLLVDIYECLCFGC